MRRASHHLLSFACAGAIACGGDNLERQNFEEADLFDSECLARLPEEGPLCEFKDALAFGDGDRAVANVGYFGPGSFGPDPVCENTWTFSISGENKAADVTIETRRVTEMGRRMTLMNHDLPATTGANTAIMLERQNDDLEWIQEDESWADDDSGIGRVGDRLTAALEPGVYRLRVQDAFGDCRDSRRFGTFRVYAFCDGNGCPESAQSESCDITDSPTFIDWLDNPDSYQSYGLACHADLVEIAALTLGESRTHDIDFANFGVDETCSDSPLLTIPELDAVNLMAHRAAELIDPAAVSATYRVSSTELVDTDGIVRGDFVHVQTVVSQDAVLDNSAPTVDAELTYLGGELIHVRDASSAQEMWICGDPARGFALGAETIPDDDSRLDGALAETLSSCGSSLIDVVGSGQAATLPEPNFISNDFDLELQIISEDGDEAVGSFSGSPLEGATFSICGGDIDETGKLAEFLSDNELSMVETVYAIAEEAGCSAFPRCFFDEATGLESCFGGQQVPMQFLRSSDVSAGSSVERVQVATNCHVIRSGCVATEEPDLVVEFIVKDGVPMVSEVVGHESIDPAEVPLGPELACRAPVTAEVVHDSQDEGQDECILSTLIFDDCTQANGEIEFAECCNDATLQCFSQIDLEPGTAEFDECLENSAAACGC